jgi:hypothetical protein
MRKFIVVETEEDKAHFVVAGLDNLATIFVSGRGSAVSLTSSLAMSHTTTTYAVYVVETTSEEDRFFKSWLADAQYLASRAINDCQGSILPASPSIEAACKNEAWVERLKQRLDGNREA